MSSTRGVPSQGHLLRSDWREGPANQHCSAAASGGLATWPASSGSHSAPRPRPGSVCLLVLHSSCLIQILRELNGTVPALKQFLVSWWRKGILVQRDNHVGRLMGRRGGHGSGQGEAWALKTPRVELGKWTCQQFVGQVPCGSPGGGTVGTP